VKIQRLLLGFLSWLFLAAGFVRAAEWVDPVAYEAPVSSDDVGVPAPECTVPCSVQD
jgi:hypothetical protein